MEITESGWHIVPHPPTIHFRRCAGMLPVPKPDINGSFDPIQDLLNLESNDDAVLIVAWLLGCCHPTGPYPILDLAGEHGSTKSTIARLLRLIIDPNKTPLRSPPKNEHDLIISAHNSWVVCYDNVSKMPEWLSDALCRMATTGGFSTRTLYTDEDETIFSVTRPVLLNGIENLLSRNDLADRAILITTPFISGAKIKTMGEVEEQFKNAISKILGRLFDAIAMWLRSEKAAVVESLPRMADFAKMVICAEPALPWSQGRFMEAYNRNREGIVRNSIHDDVLGDAIVNFMSSHETWQGSPSELLKALSKVVDSEVKTSKSWPKDPSALGKIIRRLSAFLRRIGLEITDDRSNKQRQIVIKKLAKVTGGDGT